MRSLAPLRLPGFSHLAGAYAANELGNWIGEIALAVLVFDQTGSPLATAALFIGMQFAPGFLGQALVARVEPHGTKRMLPLLYLAEAATFVALAATAESFALWLVVALATVDGTLAIGARALTRAAAAAVLKPHGLLREGNAIINVGFTGAGAVGPVLAGIAVATVGVETALLIDAASFVLVAATLAAATALPQVRAQPERWWARLREGFAYVAGKPVLRRLMTMQAVAFVFFSLVLPIEIVYAKETLDVGDSGYGALLSAWGIGMVLGSLVFLAGHRVKMGALLFFSTLAVGVSYLGMSAAGTLAVACAAAALGGVGNGVQWVAVMSTVQGLTDDRFQARVAGLLESISVAMPGIGFVLGGVITELLDARAGFALAGFGVIAVLLVAVPLLRGADWSGAEVAGPAAPGEAAEPLNV
jgi:MFS family permease